MERAVETIADQGRDTLGVIQVGMGEDNGIDVRGADSERSSVAVTDVCMALEQPERGRYVDPVTRLNSIHSGMTSC